MEDYKERAKNEYYALVDKVEKLGAIIGKAKLGMLDFSLNCPIELLDRQYKAMSEYVAALEERNKYEHFI